MGKFFFVIFSLPKFGPCFCVLFVCLFHKICVHACEYDEGMTFHLVILCITCIVAGVKKGTGRGKGNLGSREPCAYALPHCLLYVRIAVSLFIYNNILCFLVPAPLLTLVCDEMEWSYIMRYGVASLPAVFLRKE